LASAGPLGVERLNIPCCKFLNIKTLQKTPYSIILLANKRAPSDKESFSQTQIKVYVNLFIIF
jgi:hypothetical protein